MRHYVDRLSTALVEQYKLYVETFTVDLWCDYWLIEFRVGFALRVDHKLRSLMIKVNAAEAFNDVERRAVIAAMFVEIEDQIDEAITANLIRMN